MNTKSLVAMLLCIGLSACAKEKGEQHQLKSAFLDSCVKQESASRDEKKAKSYCDCVADSVFSNREISATTKQLMPTMNDKNSDLYKQQDASKVRGALMGCYTSNFYKK